MVKLTMVVTALASLTMLAAAQPTEPAATDFRPSLPKLPSLSSPDGLQAHLLEIMNLQRAQLQASLKASRPALDDNRACYYEDKAYSEGAVWTSPKGQSLRCQRDATNAFATSAPLSWVPQR